MQASSQTASVSKKMLWAGRIMSALPVLFLLIDGVMKLFKPTPVVEATVRLGYPERVLLGLGITLIVCSNTTWREGRLTVNFRQPFDMIAITNAAWINEKAAGVDSGDLCSI